MADARKLHPAARSHLSPVVLRPEFRVQIADGYHRPGAAVLTHEDALGPGRTLFT